jgi:hypothetical protein
MTACPSVAPLLRHNLTSPIATSSSSSTSSSSPSSSQLLSLSGKDALRCHQFIYEISESVRRRIVSIPPRSPATDGTRSARVGVLFSGGIDCLLLALMAHCHLLPIDEPIDLINVAFAGISQPNLFHRTLLFLLMIFFTM